MALLYKLLLLCIAIPAIFALTYDAHLYLMKPEDGFKLRPAGFFWVNLSPDTYNAGVDNLPPEIWANISAILILPGVYVFGVIALILYLVLGTIKRVFFREADLSRPREMDYLQSSRHSKAYTYKRRR